MSTAMANQHARVLSLVVCAATALSCTIVPRSAGTDVPASAAPSPTPVASTAHPTEASPAPSMGTTPGLLLRGSIHFADGTPLEGVTICRSFASYPGKRVAITGSNGEFAAEFAGIPGDEMITVWPYLEGYSFDPPQVYWRHYYGVEASALTFAASDSQPDATRATPCQ